MCTLQSEQDFFLVISVQCNSRSAALVRVITSVHRAGILYYSVHVCVYCGGISAWLIVVGVHQ